MKKVTRDEKTELQGKRGHKGAYLSFSVLSVWRMRIPWLLVLMISATVSGVILNRFEASFPSILLIFVPMLMDTGGNSGAQASATVIRALSLSEVEFEQLPEILWKECRIGFLCGITLGAVAYLKVILIDGVLMQTSYVTPRVALCVAISVSLTVTMAKLIGALLPIFAKRIGLDPAAAASPIITTVVDIAALLTYFLVSAALISPV